MIAPAPLAARTPRPGGRAAIVASTVQPRLVTRRIHRITIANPLGLSNHSTRSRSSSRRSTPRALHARDFKGSAMRELLGPRDLSLDEATRIIGAAIGKPDLKYVQFPYEAALDAMVSGGLSTSMATLYVEMSKAFNEGLVKPVEGRNARNTTLTRFEDFASTALAPAYRAQ